MSLDISDVRVIRVGIIGLDGESADAARMAAIEANLTTLLGRPVIVELASIPNVDTSGAADGNALIYDAGTETWIAGPVSGAISSVQANGVEALADVSILNFKQGTTAYDEGDGRVSVIGEFAGTGAMAKAARSDHVHTQASFHRAQYSAKGSHSSGTLTLASLNATLANGVPYLVHAVVHSKQRANGSESSYYYLRLTLNGTNAADTLESQCVGFVPDPQTHAYGWQVTGAGTSVTVAAQIIYSAGVPVLVDAGQLVVTLIPAR